jgi:hypothetical protein
MGHASEKLRTPEANWLFKRVADSVKCLCILELANGDYWVVDSPTGTYMSGHADRWHWRLAEAEYLAQGYVREFEAKSRGFISPSWSRATPSRPWSCSRCSCRDSSTTDDDVILLPNFAAEA